MHNVFKYILLVTAAYFITSGRGYAQDDNSESRSLNKKQRKAMHSRDSVLRSFNKADTSVNSQLQKLEQYSITFNLIKNNLATGLDTADVSAKVPSTLRRINKIRDQANTHKSSTLRYLFVLRDNLDHLQKRLEGWQDDLDAVDDKLIQNQNDLLKFTKDSLILTTIPTDSVLRKTFFDRRKEVILSWITADSANRKNLFKINLLQNRVAIAYSNALDETDQIDLKVKKFAQRAFEGEFGAIWDIDPQYNNIKTSIQGTADLNSTQLYYFIRKETSTHFISLVFLVIVVGWVLYNRQKIRHEHENPELIFNQANYIYKYPVISTLLVPVVIIPYFYDHPPVIFLECFFLTALVLVLMLVKRTLHANLFKALRNLFLLTIVYSASNLLIQITNLDRFVILFLSMGCTGIAYYFNRKVTQTPADYPRYTGVALRIFIGLQILALICDISGRFSLAKILSITAVYNLWLLVSLYYVVEIISQGLLLQFQSKKDEDNLVSWIDYALLHTKIRKILNVGAALLWLFFLFQNLNIDDSATDYITGVLSQKHTVGGAQFTFSGFVVFIGVIWISSVLSKIISYFYDISAQRSTDIDALKKKNRTSTLLIRIGVFTVGFFLAVFASNFPLDKITIIISAFGIGIGFGLQNIVNNLVSGLILAFEKPVQIGDIIEVDNRSGTIQEIGIRASKIATADGAEVIIPNGDLISHHVINWTLSNNNRRIELIISVKYGTEIEKVKNLLLDLLNAREDVMKEPKPLVFLHNLTGSAVDFRVLFWAEDIGHWMELKTYVLSDIFTIFEKEGIQMSTTSQDLNLKLPEVKAMNIDDMNLPDQPGTKPKTEQD